MCFIILNLHAYKIWNVFFQLKDSFKNTDSFKNKTHTQQINKIHQEIKQIHQELLKNILHKNKRFRLFPQAPLNFSGTRMKYLYLFIIWEIKKNKKRQSEMKVNSHTVIIISLTVKVWISKHLFLISQCPIHAHGALVLLKHVYNEGPS